MSNKNELFALAKKISKAGRIISKNHIDKDYIVGKNSKGSIIVTSDSGYEAIYIGDIQSKNKGYMCLYTNNTSKRNSYPTTEIIAELLEKVVNKEKLEMGEGKASYYDWEEFGGMKKQLNYFSEVVNSFLNIA